VLHYFDSGKNVLPLTLDIPLLHDYRTIMLARISSSAMAVFLTLLDDKGNCLVTCRCCGSRG